jgi:hypothetical protein
LRNFALDPISYFLDCVQVAAISQGKVAVSFRGLRHCSPVQPQTRVRVCRLSTLPGLMLTPCVQAVISTPFSCLSAAPAQLTIRRSAARPTATAR